MNKITEETARDLTDKYGSPLFVFSAERIRSNLEVFTREFSGRYKNSAVAYSYKVNYLSGILSVIHEQGAWAEVASGFEYGLAKKEGVPGEKIVFNGPLKSKEELITAIEDGAYINADHQEELDTLGEISKEHSVIMSAKRPRKPLWV